MLHTYHILIFLVFLTKSRQTDRLTDGRTDPLIGVRGRIWKQFSLFSYENVTDRRTDRPSYRHARTHLKTGSYVGKRDFVPTQIEVFRWRKMWAWQSNRLVIWASTRCPQLTVFQGSNTISFFERKKNEKTIDDCTRKTSTIQKRSYLIPPSQWA